ncbi:MULTISPECIES: putative DNA-binding protein [Clostridium]|uniref:putative DNA-binding protein n=1 Tax=Clostridium TaxID=1485 RepID=UPI00082479A5|nr:MULTISPECIES: putative DNA-binding protein [Clostridium]PJI06614.1 putative DNA-binding protein [Clostridium sp. CT7]
MEERIYYSILLSTYGTLLTEKQLNVMKLYYDDDLSMPEIAELNNTTRQAIYDLIKRCHKVLLNYEHKLKLLDKYHENETIKKNVKIKFDILKNKIHDKDNIKLINDIENELDSFKL